MNWLNSWKTNIDNNRFLTKTNLLCYSLDVYSLIEAKKLKRKPSKLMNRNLKGFYIIIIIILLQIYNDYIR